MLMILIYISIYLFPSHTIVTKLREYQRRVQDYLDQLA